MNSGRVEAFSDGVIAIIITIMVLEIEAPDKVTFNALVPLIPIFISYVLSFIYVGTYWNNHHHLFHITENVNGKVLWANLFLLFWLSLIPFTTSWIGENHLSALPTALYGVVLLMSGIAYYILEYLIVKAHPEESDIRDTLGNKRKNILSLTLYLTGIVLSFFVPFIAILCYVLVLIIWFVPNKTIEKILQNR